MTWFAVLGVLLVIIMILAAVTSYRARKRAEMVGTSPEENRSAKGRSQGSKPGTIQEEWEMRDFDELGP